MKIALVTDTHFGARGDHQTFDRFFEQFYNKVFFPVIDKLQIEHVVHLGDMFERRKFVNYVTLSSCRRYFFEELHRRGTQLHVIVGNHDIFYKNTLEVNSPDLLLGKYENVRIIQEPITQTFGGITALMIPWMCDKNMDATMELLKNAPADIVFGHLDVTGFEMYRGQVNTGGFNPSLFSRFESVYSGHFHHRSTKGNITYLGNPYEITWADYNDPRGFHILDTDTRQLNFIENPFRMFHKLEYNDKDTNYNTVDVRKYAERHVKVLVINKTDQTMFDAFIDKMYNVNPVEIKIIENSIDYDDQALNDKTVDVEDTMSLLEQYVDSIDLDLDKDKFKTFLKGLYVEAQQLEEEGL